MTHKEAEKRVVRVTLLILMFLVFSLGTLFTVVEFYLAGRSITWLQVATPLMPCIVTLALLPTMSRRKAERDFIKLAWQETIDKFSLFMFFVAHELRKDERTALLHLWGFHTEKSASRDWNFFQFKAAAEKYPGGAEMFLYTIARMCGSGRLEYSSEHFHNLVIGGVLWDVAKKKYPLSDFSIRQRSEIEAAERAVEAASV